MLKLVEALWRRAIGFNAKSNERSAPFEAFRSLLQGTHRTTYNLPETSYPINLFGTPRDDDDFYKTIWMETSCQTSLADKKVAFESLVRDNLSIDRFSIFSSAEETAFIDNVRGCCSDQALLELFNIFAAKYCLLNDALLQSVRANANLV